MQRYEIIPEWEGRRIYGDVVQDLVCGDISGYGAKVVESVTEVLVDSAWTGLSTKIYPKYSEDVLGVI